MSQALACDLSWTLVVAQHRQVKERQMNKQQYISILGKIGAITAGLASIIAGHLPEGVGIILAAFTGPLKS